jgi:hypothetical protein
VSPPTLPAGRPRWAVVTVRAVPAALAALAVAVLALTAGARPAPDPDRAPADRVVIVPETTLRPPQYVPVPAGPPCPPVDPDGSS